MIRVACLALTITALSSPALSQIYKCTEPDGRISYQETPCPRGARGGELALDAPLAAPSAATAQGRSAPPVNLATARPPSIADVERDLKRMELDRRKRAIGFDIDALEREIRVHQESQERELRDMREQQARAAANPFEAGRAPPSAADMLAVSQRYQGMIAMAQDRIAALQQEARRLDAAPAR